MIKLKQQIAIVLTLIALFPTTMQLTHAFEHEHIVCNSKNTVHLHELQSECSVYHQQINHNSFDIFVEDYIKTPFFNNEELSFKIENREGLFVLNSNSRGPPIVLLFI